MAFLQRDIDARYRRVLAALEAEFTDIPADSTGEAAASGLRAQFEIIEGKSAAQAGFHNQAQAGTDERAVARRNLYKFRQKLAGTAEIVAREKPGFDENYPSPSEETDAELLANSRAVAAQAVADKADFIGLGLKQTYVESGADLADAFEASFEATDAALASRGAAVGGKKEARRLAANFFARLDRYILNHYGDHPDKLRAWEIASRVERSPSKKKGGETR